MTDEHQDRASDLAPFLSDAAHFPGGHAAGIVCPRSVDEIVEAVRSAPPILAVGAQSSLTGGATPMGETILSTTRMARILDVSPNRIVVEPGVTVAEMQDALATVGAWFPPSPTYSGATAGGIVATNAAGAATFKYGSTRPWVEAITVVLDDGTVLEITRGTQRTTDRRLVVRTRSGDRLVPVPAYRMPDVPKCSAGYYAAASMDLIDLFIGSEGTLGVIAKVVFRVASSTPPVATAWVPCPTERTGIALAKAIRTASIATWQTGDSRGIDVSAIEHLDQRSLAILQEDGIARRHALGIPRDTTMVLLIQLELPARWSAEHLRSQIEGALGDAPDTPIVRFCRVLQECGVLDASEIALPGETRRRDDWVSAREAVPSGVNRRIAGAKQTADPRIEKTAADMIVPFERFGEMMEIYRRGFEARGLDYAIWGHISDGNVHPNVIPRTLEDVVRGKAAILEFGRQVARLGGCPLAEHGVGRSPTKQSLLRQFYGDPAIDEMRTVKRALDPGWNLAPGVIFSRD